MQILATHNSWVLIRGQSKEMHRSLELVTESWASQMGSDMDLHHLQVAHRVLRYTCVIPILSGWSMPLSSDWIHSSCNLGSYPNIW